MSYLIKNRHRNFRTLTFSIAAAPFVKLRLISGEKVLKHWLNINWGEVCSREVSFVGQGERLLMLLSSWWQHFFLHYFLQVSFLMVVLLNLLLCCTACVYKIFSFFDKCKKKLCILSNLQAIIFTISFLIALNTLSKFSYFFVSLLKAA